MILGIDIGGTNIKFGVTDDEFNIIEKYSIPTKAERTDMEILSDITKQIVAIDKKYNIDAIGIGSPGTLDVEKGIGILATNLPYNNTRICEFISEHTQKATFLENDAICAAYGELYCGCGKEADTFIMVTLGTGVGGGAVINRQIYSVNGKDSCDIGHMIIKFDGEMCPCGQRGCFEQYASVTALISQTKEAIKSNPDSILAKTAVEDVTGKTVFDAACAGCDVAQNVINTYIDYLSAGIQNCVNIFQPEAIVIGGAISKQGDNILLPLKKRIKNMENIKISSLGNVAGIIGAAAMAKSLH